MDSAATEVAYMACHYSWECHIRASIEKQHFAELYGIIKYFFVKNYDIFDYSTIDINRAKSRANQIIKQQFCRNFTIKSKSLIFRK